MNMLMVEAKEAPTQRRFWIQGPAGALKTRLLAPKALFLRVLLGRLAYGGLPEMGPNVPRFRLYAELNPERGCCQESNARGAHETFGIIPNF